MMEGKIKSYVKEKKYGFIDGEDGNKYFFHISEFKKNTNKNDIRIGNLVTFDPTPTAKGLRAKKLSIRTTALPYYEIPDRFIVSKTNTPKYGKVIYSTEPIEFSASSPDEAKKKLFDKIKSLNANAVLELTYSKTKANDGNYIYSVHHYSGKAALIAYKKSTMRKDKSEESITALNNNASIIDYSYTMYLKEIEEDKRNRQNSKLFLWSILILFFLMLVFS